MILSNQCIRRAYFFDEIHIDPYDDKRVQPASYDLTLDATFIFRDERRVVTSFMLWPGEFVLGSTVERVTLPADIMGIVSGCSTEGRRGLIVEMAGVIDPGFDGTITLEMFNCGQEAIRLDAGMRIAQIVFYRLCCPANPPYNGRYQHQHGATAPIR